MPLPRPPDGVAPRVGLTPGIGISASPWGADPPPVLLLWQQSVVICCSSTGTTRVRPRGRNGAVVRCGAVPWAGEAGRMKASILDCNGTLTAPSRAPNSLKQP
ncbi:hypothetical protein WME76_33315 [Sorangium sp. So ce119]|uniref:hypothetical protein n=1 Tax=Sorangium sp. So ce119 TaxID=3133279 RepID=UPI003F5D7066